MVCVAEKASSIVAAIRHACVVFKNQIDARANLLDTSGLTGTTISLTRAQATPSRSHTTFSPSSPCGRVTCKWKAVTSPHAALGLSLLILFSYSVTEFDRSLSLHYRFQLLSLSQRRRRKRKRMFGPHGHGGYHGYGGPHGGRPGYGGGYGGSCGGCPPPPGPGYPSHGHGYNANPNFLPPYPPQPPCPPVYYGGPPPWPGHHPHHNEDCAVM